MGSNKNMGGQTVDRKFGIGNFVTLVHQKIGGHAHPAHQDPISLIACVWLLITFL